VTVGVCVVGSGGIASAHADALAHTDDVRRRWVISRRPDAAEQFRQEWAFERGGIALEDALADDHVDVVLIASPNQVHAKQAAQALDAGKHVIVEIPAALNIADCERLEALARSVGKRLFVCHTMRSFAAIRELRARVVAGSIDISQVLGFFAIPRRSNEGWSGTRSWIDNLLWHHACHQVDAALWVLGLDGAEGVSARFGRVHPDFGMAMELSLTFSSASRQLVTHALTYNTSELVWELRFVTDQGLFTFRNGELLDQSQRTLVPAVSVRDVSRQDDAIFAALASDNLSDYDLEQVMPSMRVLDLAERSMETADD
jgi:2-hydroxy-4-carboxymuconate semialdehyde hemiacetal dehydrogenase